MSSVAPPARLGWRLLPAVVAAAAAVVAASLAIAALRTHPIVTSQDSRAAAGIAPGADVAAATPWRTDAFVVGASGRLTRSQSARFVHQKDRVRTTVRDLADALVIRPGRLARVAGRVMTSAAGASLKRQAPALPAGSADVTIIERTGRVGIQAPRFAAAAARTKIVTEATIDSRTVRWRDDFTFWLERAGGKWTVIAFDIDRIPLR